MTYPIELIAQGIKRFIAIFFFVLLWYAISQSSDMSIDMQSIVAYYLISSGVNELIGARYGDLGRLLGKEMIKNGDINNLLIKPLNIIPFVYAQSIGRVGVRMIISLISIIVGLAISKDIVLFGIFSGILFTLIATVTATSINVMESMLFIYITDAEGFRSSINHFKSLLSGIYIPLSYFPQALRSVVELSPFAVMVYVPTLAFKFKEFNSDFFKYLGFSILWAIVTLILSILLWKISRKKYEAIGI